MERTSGLTYADLQAYDDEVRREIIDGELIVSPSPRRNHQQFVGRLHLLLGPFVLQHQLGELLVGPFDVVLGDGSVCAPDLLFVASDRLEHLNDKNIQGPPTLVIEVLSNVRRDRVLKRDTYGRNGVPEYWIIDPDSDWVDVYRLAGDGYGKPMILRPGDLLTSPELPGLEIDLTDLFRFD